ncbi:unnamed protein product, partial [Closterium sp. Naga37s-1]
MLHQVLGSLSLVPLLAALACLAPWTAVALPMIDQSQGAVLQELQTNWQLHYREWKPNGDCSNVQGLTCNPNGTIASMSVVCQSSSTWALPSSFSKLVQLTSLALPSNQISTLGPLGNAYYSNLQNLNLSYNPFGTDSLLNFNKFALLTSLDLSGCQLTSDHFLQRIDLPNMLYLNVSNNKLTGSLPDSLANMDTLVYLNVSVNLLQGTISPSFGGLSNLSTLATSSTSLKCPDSYTSCGVPQNTSSAFCRTCPDFCATCDQSKPFPVGAIIGIVIGAVVVIVLFALILYYHFFRRDQGKALVQGSPPIWPW